MGSSVVLLVLRNFFSWTGLVARDAERFCTACAESSGSAGPDPSLLAGTGTQENYPGNRFLKEFLSTGCFGT